VIHCVNLSDLTESSPAPWADVCSAKRFRPGRVRCSASFLDPSHTYQFSTFVGTDKGDPAFVHGTLTIPIERARLSWSWARAA
jgi:hypothetical protein